jgi:chromosome partitioning protein
MVISVASQKGGTGKTSTSISLAAGLAYKGQRVLLVDIDSQANSSKVLLREYPRLTKEQTIYSTILNRIFMYRCSYELVDKQAGISFISRA